MDYNTLHIFAYGEIQLITDSENKKVQSSALLKLQSVIDNVYSLKPADSDAGTDYRTINIFNNLFADYSDNQDRRFRVEYSDLNVINIQELIQEIVDM